MKINFKIWFFKLLQKIKSSYYVPLSLFFFRKDVSDGYLKLKLALAGMQESTIKSVSPDEIHTLIKEAKDFEKYSSERKTSETLQWRAAVPGIVVLVLTFVSRQFNPESTEMIVCISIICRYLSLVVAVILTWNSIASMGLLGRRISFCRSFIFEMRQILGYQLDFFELEKECVEKTGGLTKAFSSVTRQEIGHMFMVLFGLFLVLFITSYHEYETLKDIYIHHLKF